jgi:HAD superfamily hydrolase (TIGR01549 family)
VIVFDVDGTLVNSFLDFKALKKGMGFSPDSFVLEELEKIQNGERKRELLNFLHEFEMEGAKKSIPFEGILEFLDYCDEKGFKRAVFTRNSHRVVEIIFNKFGMSFEKIISRDSLCDYKPHPKGLEVIGSYFKVGVKEILFIGDHYHDVLTGKRAGVRTFLFNNGNHDISGWDFKADFIFDDYFSLKGIFEKRFFGK